MYACQPIVVSRVFWLALLCLGSSVAPPPVLGSDDEIIVSARKREERLQEVPLSIATFDADALRARNIQSVYDVATFTPNFNFNRNSVGRRLDAPSIRGQFTPLQNFGSEGNVAFFVDGVYVSGTAASLTADNLERIEILRGPQAALFGRAAFAGAVNYVTREPGSDLEGQVYLKAGEGNDFKTSAFVSGPLGSDRLRGLISASWESFDGEWSNNLIPCAPGQTAADGCQDFRSEYPVYQAFWGPGQPPSLNQPDFTPLGGESSWNVTTKLNFIATDNLSITLKADFTGSDDEHYASLFQPDLNCYVPGDPDDPRADITRATSPGWRCGEIAAAGLSAVMNIADLREGATSSEGTAAPAPFIGTRTDTQRYLAEAVLALEGWDLTGRATLNRQELESYRDLDRSPYLGPLWLNLFASGELQRWDDHSFEVRATSSQDEGMRVTAGAYYFSSEAESYQREFTGFCNRVEYGLPEVNGRRSWTLDGRKENLAFFGGVDVDLVDDVTLSVEGRYARDSPEQRAANGVVAEANFYSFTPRVTVQWQLTGEANVYALAAKGNKPGGFFFGYFDAPVVRAQTEEALANGRARIKEEEAWTYEVGAKTRWFDRRLTANISLYYIDWKNQAINEIDFIEWECPDTGLGAPVQSSFIRNAGKSEVTGGEVELSLAVTDNLLLAVNYGLARTELKNFNSLVIDGLVDPAVLAAQGRLGNNAAGNEAPRVPEHTLSASATWSRPFGDRGANWFLRGDYVYNSRSWVDAENEAYVGALNLVNTRIGVENDAWTATLYVDNLTDDDTPLLVSEFPNFGPFPDITSAFHVSPRRSRSAGITLTHRF